MGLKINGSLAGLQSTTLSGAGLFVAQRAMQRPTHDVTKRRMALPAFVSIPHGYGINGIAIPFVGGGLATSIRGTSEIVPDVSAVANMGTDITGSATLAGGMTAGRGMGCAITGSVSVEPEVSAVANMGCNIKVNQAPATIDIRDEIMNTVLPNGTTVRESLDSIQTIQNTTTATLGLSV